MYPDFLVLSELSGGVMVGCTFASALPILCTKETSCSNIQSLKVKRHLNCKGSKFD